MKWPYEIYIFILQTNFPQWKIGPLHGVNFIF